tara:strand:- start:527 stop:667 length:141 start_codon:yes stop_codon:yes gene_type:complete
MKRAFAIAALLIASAPGHALNSVLIASCYDGDTCTTTAAESSAQAV